MLNSRKLLFIKNVQIIRLSQNNPPKKIKDLSVKLRFCIVPRFYGLYKGKNWRDYTISAVNLYFYFISNTELLLKKTISLKFLLYWIRYGNSRESKQVQKFFLKAKLTKSRPFFYEEPKTYKKRNTPFFQLLPVSRLPIIVLIFFFR